MWLNSYFSFLLELVTHNSKEKKGRCSWYIPWTSRFFWWKTEYWNNRLTWVRSPPPLAALGLLTGETEPPFRRPAKRSAPSPFGRVPYSPGRPQSAVDTYSSAITRAPPGRTHRRDTVILLFLKRKDDYDSTLESQSSFNELLITQCNGLLYSAITWHYPLQFHNESTKNVNN